MNWKSTVALLVLVAAAGAWLWKGDTWAPGTVPKSAPPDPPALTALEADFKPAAITRIEIAPAGADPFVFERAGSEWKQPGNWPLRSAEVNELIEALGNLRTRFQPVALSEDGNLAPFGLTDAQKPLSVKVTAGGKEYALKFGEADLAPGAAPFTRPAFVRVGDAHEVLKLGPDVMPVLRRPADSYRRRQLFADVERVKFPGMPQPVFMPGVPPEPPVPTVQTLAGAGVEEIRVVAKSPKPFGRTPWPYDNSFTLKRIAPTPAPSATEKNAEPTVRQERLAEAWAVEAPVCDRPDPVVLKRILGAVPDLWVENFVPAKEVHFAADHPFAIAQLMPTLEPFPAALVRLYPDAAVLSQLNGKVAPEARAKLDKSEQSITVTTKGGPPVTVKFGGLTIATREESETLPGPEPRTETRLVTTTHRYAQVEGNPQLFTVSADKVTALMAPARNLVESRVARFRADEVQALTVAHPGKPPIVLSRKKGNPKATKQEEKEDRWFIEGGANPLLADANRVDEFINLLAGFNGDSATDLYRADPKARGLDPAKCVSVTITARENRPDGEPDAPARESKLLIGQPDLAAGKLPVQLVGWPRITLVDDRTGPPPAGWLAEKLFPERLESVFKRDSVAYRSRKLLDTADPKVKLTGVTVDGASGFALKQEKTPDGKEVWKLTAPIVSEADLKAAEVLRQKLSELHAVEYVAARAANPATYGLDKPKFTAVLAFNNGRTYKLEVGGPRPDKKEPGKEEVYARLDGDAVFTLPVAETDALATGALKLLPLQVWNVPLEKLTGVEIERPDALAESFVLVKDGTNWKLSGPFMAPVTFLDAQPLTGALTLLPAVKYVALSAPEPAKYGFDKPFARVKLSYTEKGSDGDRPVSKTLVIGGVTPDGLDRYARLGDPKDPNAPVFVLPAEYQFAVQTPPLSLLDRHLLRLDASKITKLQITGEKPESAVTLTKDDKGAWKADGAAFAVDAVVVRQTVEALAPLPVERLAAYGTEVKWADYGLEKPEYTITITLAGDKPETHKVQLGKRYPLGGPWVGQFGGIARYMRVDDGPALGVLAGAAEHALTRQKLDFADRTLLTFKPEELLGIVRTRGKDELELAPGAGDGWDVVKPAKQKADKPLMEELADALGHLRAESVVAFGKKEDVFKQYGLDMPEATITLTVGEKAEQKVLRFGRPVSPALPDGARYAAVESSAPDAAVCVLPAVLTNKLLAPPVSFRDRTIVKFVDADKLELQRGPRKVTFAKVNGTWKVTAPLTADAEQAVLDDLVNELAKLRANDWAADKPTPAELKTFGLENPEATWTVNNGDKVVLTLHVGKTLSDGRAYATANTGGAVALLGVPQTAKVLGEYRVRKPWTLDAFQAESVEIARGDKPFTLKKIGMTWSDPAAPTDVINPRAVAELLGTLTALRVERFAVDTEGDPKLFGLEKPEVTITVTLKDGATRALAVGGFVGGTDNKQRYARVIDKDRSDVFILSALDTERLTRDRAAFVQKK
jgi:hypothetical protein